MTISKYKRRDFSISRIEFLQAHYVIMTWMNMDLISEKGSPGSSQ